MKLNLRQIIKDYEGKDIVEGEDKKPLNLTRVIITAVNTWLPEERPTAEDKAKVYQLSLKTYGVDEVDYAVDDLSFIKERVGKVYTALVFGRVCDIIDPKGK